MSEQIKFTEENKKTVVAFITGLLVGGLLVYIFANPAEKAAVVENSTDNDVEEIENIIDDEEVTDVATSVISTTSTSPSIAPRGDGSIEVSNQEASDVVVLDSVSYPSNSGWVGVRDYENGQLIGLLGVSRWNTEEGLLPKNINLLRSTEAGKTYAVVFFSDNGDKEFSLANDVQFSDISATFIAE